MTVRISVIVPTIGRDTLQAALDSCAGAYEVIVDENHDGDHGYAGRMRAMAKATGTHLAFLDDDDVFVPGALETMTARAADVPVIFKMDDPTHGILWADRELRLANVGTPMFLVPNVPDKLGEWKPYAHGRCGDFSFITSTVEKMGAPKWVDELVCVVRPPSQSVAIVTPWHNHPEFKDDYGTAVSVCRAVDEVLIVDNGSEPPIESAIRLDWNSGFAFASNIGMYAATTDAVLFLNNDIRATDRNWLEQIRDAIEPGVLVGAELRNDPHGRVAGMPMPYLDGWCVGGMRDDLIELGGWDEGYMEPSYYGDNDLSLRARAAGMTLREVRCGLVHKVNGTARDMNVTAATLANRERFHRAAMEIMEGVAA